jgi:heme exporter protein A
VTALLRFDRATLSRGGRLLFEDLDLLLGAGDALQVTGPNGSGKSSLIRLAAGLLSQRSGRVERSPAALSDDRLALDRELPLGRALGFWCDGRRLDAAMEAMRIGHLGDVPVRLLSTGQARRASLARVAASGAALWLLDEPVNGLDSDGVSRLDGLIAEHRSRGGGVVAASHAPLAGAWNQLELGA